MEDKEPSKQTEDPTYKEYMKLYRRKMYKEQPDKIKAKNKAYYYKQKFNASNDEMAKYDVYLPSILRIKNELDKLNRDKPEFVKEIILMYQ